MQKTLDTVVASSMNFGYLAQYEPTLAYDGASAESYVYEDPDVALRKARRFADTMTTKAAAVLGVHLTGGALYDRINELYDAGVLAGWVRDTFHEIRDVPGATGRHRLDLVRAAMVAVRDCFDLGLWLHNTIRNGQEVRAFVPPQPPGTLLPRSPAPEALPAATELRALLDGFEHRLTAVELDRVSRNGTTWSRTGAVAHTMGRMADEKVTADVVRALADRVEARFEELAEDLHLRLEHDRYRYRGQRAELWESALRASLAGYGERQRLVELLRTARAAREAIPAKNTTPDDESNCQMTDTRDPEKQHSPTPILGGIR